jgi:hypothetical protein
MCSGEPPSLACRKARSWVRPPAGAPPPAGGTLSGCTLVSCALADPVLSFVVALRGEHILRGGAVW